MDSAKQFFEAWSAYSSSSSQDTSKKLRNKKKKTSNPHNFTLYYDENATYQKSIAVPYLPKKQKKQDKEKDIYANIPLAPAQWYAEYFTPWLKHNETQGYLKELWKPIYKIIRSNSVGIESLNKILNTEKYENIIKDMFDLELYFTLPSETDLKNKPSNIWTQISPINWIEQGWKQVQNWWNNNNNLQNKTEENETQNLTINIEMQSYLNSIKNLQQTLTQIGKTNIEKIVKQILTENTQSTKITFDEFAKLWIESMQKEIQLFLLGDNFSKIWNEVIRASLAFQKSLIS
jgi:hypothetical protein